MCLFCDLAKNCVAENELCYMIYDKFPASAGHSLIIPKRHVTTVFEMTSAEWAAAGELINLAKEMEESGIPIPPDIQNKLEKLYSSRKMQKQKSNFFKRLMNENKVKEIQVTTPTVMEEKVLFTIPRTDFESYYLESDNLDSIIDNKAEIEIISPVLKNGNYSWRGIYLKENLSHEYTMKDKDFKKKVIEESLSFQNGTRLECELEICRKLDDNGDEYNSGYKINKVFNQYIGDAVTEMPSGKKRRQKAEMEKNQPSLFDEYNEGEKNVK